MARYIIKVVAYYAADAESVEEAEELHQEDKDEFIGDSIENISTDIDIREQDGDDGWT
jgi:hypothetical protein